ncbi:MAG: metallophosphoesterase [Planctomycetes bacterium]|nr:metallophosphoesterase [Planctomycetota bacterium]
MSQGVQYDGITRRRFLTVAAAAVGGVIALTPRWSAAQDQKKEDATPEGSRSASQLTRWAFLSDTHIAGDPEDKYRGFYPYRNLQKAFTQIASDLPEGLVVTGDVARLTGQMEDYENFQKLLLPVVGRRPLYVALGNHDDRDHFLDVFESPAGRRPAVKGKHIVTVDAGPVRFILLDSLFATNVTMGLLGKAQRAWLQRYLPTCDDKPVILFFHHSLRDEDGDLQDLPRLFDIIKPVPRVKAIVYGHSHEYGFSDFEGIHLINLPAVGFNFGDDQPIGWVEARLGSEGGAFVLHALGGNQDQDGRAKELRWRS